jgi:DNA repair exonuclease SbcCD nuclease subunit
MAAVVSRPERRRRLRIVHTSDVHLTPSSGRAESPSREELALVEVVELALREAVDAVLVAGDLFDSNRIDEEVLQFAGRQLARLDCPVVLIPGNHDCYDDLSVYRRHDLKRFGSHVHLMAAEEGETVSFPELDLVVWGKALVVHEPAYRPVEGVPERPAEGWFVGLAHGFVVESRREPRSSLITPDEIEGSGLDYLALGHVHVYRDVSAGSTRACYPGAPSLPYSTDPGQVALVDLDPEVGVTIETRSIVWRA